MQFSPAARRGRQNVTAFLEGFGEETIPVEWAQPHLVAATASRADAFDDAPFDHDDAPTIATPVDVSSTLSIFAVPTNATAELAVTSAPESAGGGLIDTVQQILRPVAPNPQTLKVPSISSRITTPPANATIGSGISLTWTATTNGIYRFLMYSSAVSSADDVVVILNTSSTSVQMPDLAALGVKLTAGDYTTLLTTVSPFTSIDGICGPKATREFQTLTMAPGTKLTAK